MKKFALVALFVTLFSAGAAKAATITRDSSFDEIKAAGLIAGFPTISFQTEGVTVDELCVDGQNIRPVNPNKTTCAKFDTRHDHFDCIGYVTTYLTTPITHEEEQCLVWDTNGRHAPNCLKSEKVSVDYPLSYNISIYVEKPRAGLTELFTKSYTIPACQN